MGYDPFRGCISDILQQDLNYSYEVAIEKNVMVGGHHNIRNCIKDLLIRKVEKD